MILKRLIIFFAIIFFLGLLSVYYPYLTGEVVKDLSNVNNKEYEFEEVFVLRIIDGDTIKTSNGAIRLLAINTPERKQVYYEEAKRFLKEIENKSVMVLRDFEDIDKYDRKLRFYSKLKNISII